MTDTRRYTIEPPPSLNNIFRNLPKGGRVKTSKYRQWLERAKWAVKLARPGQAAIEGPVSVTLSMKRPRANADLDNRIKPVLDALEAGGAIVNDKNVTSICAAWGNHDGCIVTVSPDVGAAA